MQQADVIVAGGGMVGSAIALGLVREGLSVILLDGGDGDFRAARVNFGLVWRQGKGLGLPPYQRLTRDSIRAWPDFARGIAEATGVDLQYENAGGLDFCLGEAAFEAERLELARQHNQRGDDPDCVMVDRRELEKLLPGTRLGPTVTGATFGPLDGHANPLRLLAALQRAFLANAGALVSGHAVTRIAPVAAGFEVEAGPTRCAAPRLVIAAGLGAPALARQIGLDIPVRPQRGQILVTERLAPLLRLPAASLRQTGEGTVLIGATQEEVGFDTGTTTQAAAGMTRRAIAILPDLARAKLVRHWAGLRIMTPDSCPVYVESPVHRGAFVASCHSGVTLAAFHAGALAKAIAAGALPDALAPFHPRRFDVPQAA